MEQAFEFTPSLLEAAKKAEGKGEGCFCRVDEIAFENEKKVLSAFHRHNVSAAHLLGTTGYGYDDLGRDTLDKICADILGTEDALVRQNLFPVPYHRHRPVWGPSPRRPAGCGNRRPLRYLGRGDRHSRRRKRVAKGFRRAVREIPLNADGFSRYPRHPGEGRRRESRPSPALQRVRPSPFLSGQGVK